MDRIAGTEVRSVICGEEIEEIGVDSLQFGEEIRRLMAAAPYTGSSFTSLLELPANQVMELLNSPDTVRTPASLAGDHHVIEQASRFSVFPAAVMSTEHVVKLEPVNSDSNPNSSDPMTENDNRKSTKRKEREKKGTGSTKKSKSVANENSGDGEKLPYVHVRARRGQATDSHSLAERARREKINARMKLLQELVPGCNKISGTAMVLDEIINHVQSLQHQVEEAKEKFQQLQKVISILGDEEKRALYDQTGCVDDADLADEVVNNLKEFFRTMYKKVTEADIEEFEANYRGSDSEKNDLIDLYKKYKGNMNRLFCSMLCSDPKLDSHRFKDILDEAIAAGLKSTKAYQKWATKVSETKPPTSPLRHREKSKKKESDDLYAMISQRRNERGKQFDSFFSSIVSKYGRGKAPSEPTEEEFEAAKKKLESRNTSKKSRRK